MDLSSCKLDIDELINEFAEGESTAFRDMKRVWLSKRFSYIYEARPPSNSSYFMQALYAHAIGYIICPTSLSRRLGGLYCLYCLYETQPFKPPFKIYISLGELKKLKDLVVEAKEKDIKVVSVLVKRMLDMNIFLFGFVDINEGSVAERVNELTDLQNAHIQVAYKKLLANTRIEHFIHMDLGMELDLDVLKKMSTEYTNAKSLAIKEGGEVVDVQNIKHISEDKNTIGDIMEHIAEDWNVQKQVFYRQTGLNQHYSEVQQQQLEQQQEAADEDYDKVLEYLLSEA